MAITVCGQCSCVPVQILLIMFARVFERDAQSSMRPIASMLPLLCTGWVARYEVWTIADNPVCSADICIPLAADEVHLQLQCSLWQEDPSYSLEAFKCQFPLAISANIRLIAILRTVYYFTPAGNREARMEAVPLPPDFGPKPANCL